MAVGLRSLLCDGCLAGDLWGPSSARDECLHVLLGRIIRGFERRVRILESCDCLGKKEGAPKDSFMIALIRCARPLFGAVGAMRLCSFFATEHARRNNDNDGNSDAADKRRPR